MLEQKINVLKEHLQKNIKNLNGNWVKKNTNYEEDICNIIEMNLDKNRHWDSEWNGLKIELKKGKSIWLDLVRYSEYILENIGAGQKVFNLFFIPNIEKSYIDYIYGVKTERIIRKLNLDEAVVKKIIDLRDTVPRSLNAQASLTPNDIKQISTFVINRNS